MQLHSKFQNFACHLFYRQMEIKPAPHQPGLFAAANANGTVTLFDISEIIGKEENLGSLRSQLE
jgi:hypothetical protein